MEPEFIFFIFHSTKSHLNSEFFRPIKSLFSFYKIFTFLSSSAETAATVNKTVESFILLV